MTSQCVHPNTQVLLYFGGMKAAKHVIKGDILMGHDSTPHIVVSVTTSSSELFNVKIIDNENIIVTKHHIFMLYSKVTNEQVPLSIESYLTKSETFRSKHSILASIIEYQQQDIQNDPSLIGLTISSKLSNFTEIVRRYLNKKLDDISSTGIARPVDVDGIDQKEIIPLLSAKYIPDNYLYNTKNIRQRLLIAIVETKQDDRKAEKKAERDKAKAEGRLDEYNKSRQNIRASRSRVVMRSHTPKSAISRTSSVPDIESDEERPKLPRSASLVSKKVQYKPSLPRSASVGSAHSAHSIRSHSASSAASQQKTPQSSATCFTPSSAGSRASVTSQSVVHARSSSARTSTVKQPEKPKKMVSIKEKSPSLKSRASSADVSRKVIPSKKVEQKTRQTKLTKTDKLQQSKMHYTVTKSDKHGSETTVYKPIYSKSQVPGVKHLTVKELRERKTEKKSAPTQKPKVQLKPKVQPKPKPKPIITKKEEDPEIPDDLRIEYSASSAASPSASEDEEDKSKRKSRLAQFKAATRAVSLRNKLYVSDKILGEQIKFLARSLGYHAYYEVGDHLYIIGDVKQPIKTGYTDYEFNVTPFEPSEYVGFNFDKEAKYVLSNGIISQN